MEEIIDLREITGYLVDLQYVADKYQIKDYNSIMIFSSSYEQDKVKMVH